MIIHFHFKGNVLCSGLKDYDVKINTTTIFYYVTCEICKQKIKEMI
jgi:hypothetical protein